MQDESSTINAALEEPAYTRTNNSRKKKQLNPEEIGLVKEKKIDATMETSNIQEQSSRGKLYKIKKKA